MFSGAAQLLISTFPLRLSNILLNIRKFMPLRVHIDVNQRRLTGAYTERIMQTANFRERRLESCGLLYFCGFVNLRVFRGTIVWYRALPTIVLLFTDDHAVFVCDKITRFFIYSL